MYVVRSIQCSESLASSTLALPCWCYATYNILKRTRFSIIHKSWASNISGGKEIHHLCTQELSVMQWRRKPWWCELQSGDALSRRIIICKVSCPRPIRNILTWWLPQLALNFIFARTPQFNKRSDAEILIACKRKIQGVAAWVGWLRVCQYECRPPDLKMQPSKVGDNMCL